MIHPQQVPASPQSDQDGMDRNNLPSNIPTVRLIALLKASDDILESLFRRSHRHTLRLVARSVKNLLKAEAAAIFLVDEDSNDKLMLSAYELDKPFRIESVSLTIQDKEKGGMTGFIAHQGEIVRLHGPTLREHRNNARTPTIHLKSGIGFSTLGIPLKDRKGRILGVAKVDNKKGLDGIANDSVFFDEVDEYIARVLLNKIVLVLESLRIFDALRTLMESMHRVKSLEDFVGDILKTGLRLIGADRGDFLWWDARKQQLVPASQYGARTISHRQTWPERSVTYEVWHTKEPALIGDVLSDKKYRDKYYQIDPSTRSEIAICLQYEGNAIGVLNAESSRPNWFDAHDLELLQLLGHYVSIATQVTGEDVAFRGIVQRLSDPSPSREEVLTGILSSLASIYKFDAGIIFIADYGQGILQGVASIGCDELNIDPKTFVYSFDEKALSTKVFREGRGYFSASPKDDPHVQRKGLEAFQIDGPLVGVPLTYGSKVVGVLVSWSRYNVHPTEKHIELLQPFARLAATTIAASETERQRTKVLLRIGDILNQMQTELSLEKNLHLILSGIQAAGFDRVGVFEFKEETQTFIGLDSIGLERPEIVRGYQVTLANPYAAHIAQIWPTDPRAKLYNAGMFGPDPDARALGQDPELPWAKVPLVTNGKLYGYIAADNKTTKRKIQNDSLDYLTLYGALAGQAIANRQTIDVLRASKVRDDFLRQMAHTFLTNAANVKWAVHTLESGLLSYSQFRLHFLPGVLKINKQYLDFGRKIRDFGTIGSDAKLNLESTDLVGLTQEAINRLREAAEAQQVTFETNSNSLTVLGRVDRMRTAGAVEALLENAIKFSPRGGTVRVHIEASNETASIIVRDEGFGIPEEELRFIFDIFFRGRNAKDAHIEGTGIGLSIVERTMALHGGKAKAVNLNQGGAEFKLEFPLT
jgi:signal transduction histidine kinase/transcriptional regulator with GAF, ATPase, and Fis domain